MIGRRSNFKDLTGMKFGKLLAVSFFGFRKKSSYWVCKCECGKEKIIDSGCLKNGHTKSCGCYRKKFHADLQRKHGMTGTRLYNCWNGMILRTTYKNHKAYHNYGGRGIKVCKEWLDSSTFFEWAKSHGYKDNLSLDRVNNDGNYEPSNCRWATSKEQANNKRPRSYKN